MRRLLKTCSENASTFDGTMKRKEIKYAHNPMFSDQRSSKNKMKIYVNYATYNSNKDTNVIRYTLFEQ